MPNIGPLEIIILLVIVLVIFGPKRLPELGKGLGKGMREFKDSITGKGDDEPKELSASNTVQTSGQATAPPEQASPAVQQPPPVPAAAPAPPPQAEQEPEPEPEAAQSSETRA
jgi:sec-independent protein translocase protein TatA